MPIFGLSPVYPILDARFLPQRLDERSHFLQSTARSFSEIGITLIQLRSKHAPQQETMRDARILQAATVSGLQLILNDNPVMAHQLGCDGVHLGQGDMSICEARAIVGQVALIGLSTHSSAQVSTANETTADYIAIGPVFSTTTKSDAEPVVGLQGVRAGARADPQAAGGDRRHYA